MMDKIKRANKRNFFIAQNMIFDLDISEHAKITYLYLCRCADDESQAFPSYNTIAEKCSFSRSTAIRSIQELEEIGLLSVEKRYEEDADGSKVYTSNLYTLYDSPNEELISGEHDCQHKEVIPREHDCQHKEVVSHRHHPSVTQTPPLVSHRHHPSVTQTPYKYSIKNTNLINTQSINQDTIDEIGISRDLKSGLKNKKSLPLKATSDDVDTYNSYRSIIADNIGYYQLKKRYPYENMVDNLLELITEVVTSSKATIRVNGEDKPQDIVKSAFLKLTSNHIEYVMECMRKNKVKANNIKAYMITVLYNAPKTIDAYYSNLVNYDMAQMPIGSEEEMGEFFNR